MLLVVYRFGKKCISKEKIFQRNSIFFWFFFIKKCMNERKKDEEALTSLTWWQINKTLWTWGFCDHSNQMHTQFHSLSWGSRDLVVLLITAQELQRCFQISSPSSGSALVVYRIFSPRQLQKFYKTEKLNFHISSCQDCYQPISCSVSKDCENFNWTVAVNNPGSLCMESLKYLGKLA